MKKQTVENPEVKYLRAYRELNAIVASNNKVKLANWMNTHRNHAFSHLPEDSQLRVATDKLFSGN